ncbi:unnamed protein product [Vicia faba]|uniref:Uncharacterized protein n=1 Tax=Vicia faba TaxID=3906 RepID=A0AAV1AZU6_VICFA|nr:unnamed protein product [Vicia faba]
MCRDSDILSNYHHEEIVRPTPQTSSLSASINHPHQQLHPSSSRHCPSPASLTRITASASKSPIQLVHRRGLAGAADPHATPRVDIWKDPLSPSKWKEEHFVIASLTGWAVLIYGGYKLFSGGKKEEKLPEAAH